MCERAITWFFLFELENPPSMLQLWSLVLVSSESYSEPSWKATRSYPLPLFDLFIKTSFCIFGDADSDTTWGWTWFIFRPGHFLVWRISFPYLRYRCACFQSFGYPELKIDLKYNEAICNTLNSRMSMVPNKTTDTHNQRGYQIQSRILAIWVG